MCSRLYSRDDGQEALLDHPVFLHHLRPLIGAAELDEVLRFGQLAFVDRQEGLIGPKVRASQTFVGVRARPCNDGDAAIAVGQCALIHQLFEHLQRRVISLRGKAILFAVDVYEMSLRVKALDLGFECLVGDV
jgi:hypothetical protein